MNNHFLLHDLNRLFSKLKRIILFFKTFLFFYFFHWRNFSFSFLYFLKHNNIKIAFNFKTIVIKREIGETTKRKIQEKTLEEVERRWLKKKEQIKS